MYSCYRVLKTPAHKKLITDNKSIWVKAKYREIKAPNEELKKEQRKILKEELEKIKISKNAYGFVPNKDIYKNAEQHLTSNAILEIDMKNFFDTITDSHIFNSLINNGITKERAEYITRICTYQGTTPQGAPTSPYLSNIICKPMDKKINKLCKINNCNYTRYADDITVSGDFIILQQIKPKIQSIINQYGFKINGNKVRTVDSHRRQSVTGIVINEGELTISRKYGILKRLKGVLFYIDKDIKNGKIKTLEDIQIHHGVSFESIRGYANFAYNVNKDKYKKYLDQVIKIREFLLETSELPIDH